ncbi:HpcH/HpaI aldolase family protein [Candidimonas nitroreducens]|uniref:Aldolase n=1 Tax=Candidimonas nitroreducens TaxID=683354 RepID=A0A225MJZ4_9BURK|nr:aldolase/citrate lyase family protein [Candidimonas nitroreducens]OWT59229.1 aldolase [Candidimonas nitroreducens]
MPRSAQDILRNNVRDKLDRGGVVASITVRLTRGIEIARIAKTAGFDTLYIDMEHNSFSMDTTGQICMAALALDIAPFVRVPANTPEWISRVLDAGALGVIAPHVGSAEEARAVVAAAKFAPLGERSAAGGLPQLEYRAFPASESYPVMNRATMVIVQFETVAALERAEEILAVDGVDMVMIGTNDLTADMGIAGQYDHPRVREAYQRSIDICRRLGKHCGVGGLSSRPDLVAEFVKMGARYVSTGTDAAFLLQACTAKAKQVLDLEP